MSNVQSLRHRAIDQEQKASILSRKRFSSHGDMCGEANSVQNSCETTCVQSRAQERVGTLPFPTRWIGMRKARDLITHARSILSGKQIKYIYKEGASSSETVVTSRNRLRSPSRRRIWIGGTGPWIHWGLSWGTEADFRSLILLFRKTTLHVGLKSICLVTQTLRI